MATKPIYIGIDHELTLTGENVVLAGVVTYLNTATVTYAVKDSAGATVAGGTGTLSYVAASNGNYLGVIESTVTALLTEGQEYFVEITVAQGTYNDFRRLPREARYREEY